MTINFKQPKRTELNIWDEYDNCYKNYPIEDVEDALFDLSSFELMELRNKIDRIIENKSLIQED